MIWEIVTRQAQEPIHKFMDGQSSNNNMGEDVTLENFQKFGPPKFAGSLVPK